VVKVFKDVVVDTGAVSTADVLTGCEDVVTGAGDLVTGSVVEMVVEVGPQPRTKPTAKVSNISARIFMLKPPAVMISIVSFRLARLEGQVKRLPFGEAARHGLGQQFAFSLLGNLKKMNASMF
jgi:hypothetical protein